MWIADKWKDYEVIDTSCGEKLERWGDYLLVRPDPQVIWDTPKNDRGWKHHERPLSPQQKGRRRMGILRPSGAVEHSLPRADLSFKTVQF